MYWNLGANKGGPHSETHKHLEGKLNSPVAEWLNKGLMPVSSPTQNVNGDYLDADYLENWGENRILQWRSGLIRVTFKGGVEPYPIPSYLFGNHLYIYMRAFY